MVGQLACPPDSFFPLRKKFEVKAPRGRRKVVELFHKKAASPHGELLLEWLFYAINELNIFLYLGVSRTRTPIYFYSRLSTRPAAGLGLTD